MGVGKASPMSEQVAVDESTDNVLSAGATASDAKALWMKLLLCPLTPCRVVDLSFQVGMTVPELQLESIH